MERTEAFLSHDIISTFRLLIELHVMSCVSFYINARCAFCHCSLISQSIANRSILRFVYNLRELLATFDRDCDRNSQMDPFCDKRVTPISIPRRHRRPPSPLSPPSGRRYSPDLLFEMSPVSTAWSPSSTVPFATSPTSENRDDQQFMYRIPMFGSLSNRELTSTRPSISCKGIMSSRYHNVPTQTISQRMVPFEHENDSNTVGCSGGRYEPIVQTQSTNKVTGFIPLKPDQPPASDLLPRLMGRLSPSCRVSNSPFPFFHSERQNYEEEELSYSNVDPCLFEFQRHLLRRMEGKDYFTSFHSACDNS